MFAPALRTTPAFAILNGRGAPRPAFMQGHLVSAVPHVVARLLAAKKLVFCASRVC